MRWQIEQIEDGHRIVQATVLFDPDTGETRMMRSKEDAHDYRYFPDPDLLPVKLDEDWIAQIRAGLPELPRQKQARYVSELGLSAYDASVLTSSKWTADYFEAMLSSAGIAQVKACANWVTGGLAAFLNQMDSSPELCPVTPQQAVSVVKRVADGTINGKIAKEIFDALWKGEGADADQIIETRGLKQVSDSGAIVAIIEEVMAANAKSVEEFRSGKEKAFNALVGQVMKASKGKANPAQVNELLKNKLGAG